MAAFSPADDRFMRLALRLALRGYGLTSPNPMVGAVLVREGRVLGVGWHKGAGLPHAEVEAIRDAERRGFSPRGAALYVTLEPCSTRGRTPPCVEAILRAGIRRVVAATRDPNPAHAGRGFELLRAAGAQVDAGLYEREAARLNEAFNHWIVHRTPWVTLKFAATLDGKIATASGESKWITGRRARAHAMRLRQGADAILIGAGTALADDPSLTVRLPGRPWARQPRRVVLDALARTPPSSRLASDAFRDRTVILVGPRAPAERVAALAEKVEVWRAPLSGEGRIDLRWTLERLGEREVTSLLVEGGGEVHGSFVAAGLGHRLAAYFAPLILGGRDARPAVGGEGVGSLREAPAVEEAAWRALGPDLFVTGLIRPRATPGQAS